MTSRSTRAGHLAGSARSAAEDADRTLPPEPIPVPLRDHGFRRLLELLELREWTRETMCHLPGPAEAYLLRRLDDTIVAEQVEPWVAHRSFESVTHCPHGHVGQHGIGEPVVYDGRKCLERTCRYPSCAVSWVEGRYVR